MNKDSLSHTSWNCKYHIVFAPKYSVSEIMGYLKGKSSLIIFDRWKSSAVGKPLRCANRRMLVAAPYRG